MNGQPVKEKPWKAGPSELHLALSEAGTVPLRWNHHHQDTLGKEARTPHPHASWQLQKPGFGGRRITTDSPGVFLCVFFLSFFFPNTLLIDEPIISLPKAFLKLNK